MKLFIAMETDPAWLKRRRPAGRYVTTAWVPGNLLNEGMIYISAQMKTVEPAQRHFKAHQQIAFHVVDTLEGDSARGNWVGGIDSAFRPKLEWQTEVASEAVRKASAAGP